MISKFPLPLPIARKTIHARLLRRKTLLKATKRAAFLRTSVIFLELLGFVLWKSSALFLDALSSMVDLGASCLLMWCIRKADQPPDQEHPFGHGRFEPIIGLLVGFLLIFLGILNATQQISALFLQKNELQIESLSWIIPFIAVFLFEICSRQLKKVAEKKNSPALLAEAAHYRVDALTSFFALLALGLATIFPEYRGVFDHAGALLISFFMIIVGTIAGMKNIHQLLDRKPGSEFFEKVREAAISVPGVLSTEKLRVQAYGPDAYVAIDIEVDPELSVFTSHQITQKVRRAIQASWPAVRDVIVHVEPYYPGDHES